MQQKSKQYIAEAQFGISPPQNSPLTFLPQLIPAGKIAHAGIFSPDLRDFYYTLSDTNFSQFDVLTVSRQDKGWSQPREAFFNSSYMEHGVHFTVDKKWAYFSSNRPSGKPGMLEDWKIWRCASVDDAWGEPELVDVPGMEQRVMSHPSVTHSGRLYFHSYHPDFTDMTLFSSEIQDDGFEPAIRVTLPGWENQKALTAFITPDESYLLFTKKFDDFLTHEIYISSSINGDWGTPTRLPDSINRNNLGNPYITPDGNYLFYAAGVWTSDAPAHDWVIKWVDCNGIL
jgi:hypothetical protein